DIELPLFVNSVQAVVTGLVQKNEPRSLGNCIENTWITIIPNLVICLLRRFSILYRQGFELTYELLHLRLDNPIRGDELLVRVGEKRRFRPEIEENCTASEERLKVRVIFIGARIIQPQFWQQLRLAASPLNKRRGFRAGLSFPETKLRSLIPFPPNRVL